MSNKKDKFDVSGLTKWEYMQRIGKNKYIFFYGIVVYGLLLFLSYHLTLLLINMFTIENFNMSEYFLDKDNHIRFISSFVLFALMGLYFSSSSWKKQVKINSDNS